MTDTGQRLDDLDTPVLWTDLDRMERNTARLSRFFADAGIGWRPHIKGIKVPALAHKLMEAGALGVTCAKVGEAQAMAAAGITDILIANQVVGATKGKRLAELVRDADVKVAVDCEQNILELGSAGTTAGTEIGVVVELNIGMDRAGTQPGETALGLARLAHETPGLRFRGLMGWEGHARSYEDLDERRSAISEAMGLLAATAELCRNAGLPVDIVSAGGTGTYHVAAHHPGITEMQAGGATFCCARCRAWGADTEHSLFLRARVTSRPAPDRIIFDAGFKTLPLWAGEPQPLGLPAVKSIVMSAEHGIVTLEAPDSTVQVGDLHDFVVGYGDATVFLHDRLYGIREDRVEAAWDIDARGQSR